MQPLRPMHNLMQIRMQPLPSRPMLMQPLPPRQLSPLRPHQRPSTKWSVPYRNSHSNLIAASRKADKVKKMSLEGPRIKQRAPLLIGLAVLVVAAGSIGLFYLVASRQKSTAQTNTTTTVQTKTRATITSQENPYTHKGTLVLNDILNGASNSDNWE